jgi:hypothetical protein
MNKISVLIAAVLTIVEGYGGREVTLNVQKAELERFKGLARVSEE